MKYFGNWKTALAVLSVFVLTTVLLPGLSAQVMAADTPDSQKAAGSITVATASDASTGIIDESAPEGKAVATEGAAAGSATSASISGGTIALGLVVVGTAVAVGLAASSDSGSSTSHH
jgi:hypothetical protein